MEGALYGLKQVPTAWYERHLNFLMENEFKRGMIDKTLFIKTQGNDMFIVQIFDDDVLFDATNESLSKEFSNLMSKEFK